MVVDMKSCPEAITVIAEAVPITAEPIQDADAKLYDDAPVAAVCDAAPADAKHCIELEAKELDVRADPDGVRRRVVVLRDALVRGAPLDLRDDAAAGGLEDAAALSLRDADLGRTLLHHAADLGRADAVRIVSSRSSSRRSRSRRVVAGLVLDMFVCGRRERGGAGELPRVWSCGRGAVGPETV